MVSSLLCTSVSDWTPQNQNIAAPLSPTFTIVLKNLPNAKLLIWYFSTTFVSGTFFWFGLEPFQKLLWTVRVQAAFSKVQHFNSNYLFLTLILNDLTKVFTQKNDTLFLPKHPALHLSTFHAWLIYNVSFYLGSNLSIMVVQPHFEIFRCVTISFQLWTLQMCPGHSPNCSIMVPLLSTYFALHFSCWLTVGLLDKISN